MLLYRLLRFVVRVALRAFFGSITVKGLDLVPRKGGLIVAANHPSSFLDPVVVAAWLRRPLFFLANGGVFASPFTKWLFGKLFMIPIYRKQDSTEAAHKNQDTFAACYEMLARGAAIVIFPEGTSEEDRRLRQMKTGAARIALGAQAQHHFGLNLHIVCAGINYTNPRKFQSKLLVHYGEPLDTRTAQAAYQADEVKAVQALTDQMAARLQSLIVSTANPEVDSLTRDIERMYSRQLREALQLQAPETEQVFLAAQHIADALQYYAQQHPQQVQQLKQQMDEYKALLAAHHLSDETVAAHSRQAQLQQGTWRNAALAVAGLPLYLYSELHNRVPYRLPGYLALHYVRDRSFRAPINLVLGMVTFGLLYPLYWAVFYHFVHNAWLTLLYAATLPASGYFAFRYYHFVKKLREKQAFAALCAQQPQLFAHLQHLRGQLIGSLEQARHEWQARRQ